MDDCGDASDEEEAKCPSEQGGGGEALGPTPEVPDDETHTSVIPGSTEIPTNIRDEDPKESLGTLATSTARTIFHDNEDDVHEVTTRATTTIGWWEEDVLTTVGPEDDRVLHDDSSPRHAILENQGTRGGSQVLHEKHRGQSIYGTWSKLGCFFKHLIHKKTNPG